MDIEFKYMCKKKILSSVPKIFATKNISMYVRLITIIFLEETERSSLELDLRMSLSNKI